MLSAVRMYSVVFLLVKIAYVAPSVILAPYGTYGPMSMWLGTQEPCETHAGGRRQGHHIVDV